MVVTEVQTGWPRLVSPMTYATELRCMWCLWCLQGYILPLQAPGQAPAIGHSGTQDPGTAGVRMHISRAAHQQLTPTDVSSAQCW